MTDIILATKNQNKVRELKRLFEPLGIRVHSLLEFETPEIIEDGKTFEENSLKKARTIFNFTGKPTIADDSGLIVEQLNGEPGVYSARYAYEGASDEENNKKLLEKLKKHPQPHFAKFYCAASYVDSNNSFTVSGELEGQIIETPRGSNGFGYDPLFLPEGYNRTLAQMTVEEKNKISHRAKAFAKLKEKLIDELKLL